MSELFQSLWTQEGDLLVQRTRVTSSHQSQRMLAGMFSLVAIEFEKMVSRLADFNRLKHVDNIVSLIFALLTLDA